MKNTKSALVLLLVAVFALSAFAGLALNFNNNQAYAASNTVELYAINDFHGQVDHMAQVSGYLAARKSEGAILLNSGDMFQGSMESNSNYGKLLTDCMDAVGVDAFTYGNHEFDWGIDNLIELAQNSNTPFLGANIYHWNRFLGWGDFADELAQKYVIKELDNGIRVGIIGVIGSDQITSISSQLVQSIGFKDPLPIIKDLATELREEQDCDVVVVSAHAGPQDLVGEKENYQQPKSSAGLSSYVDAVFCAHTHSAQDYIVDGIPFIQGKRYGDFVSYVQLSVGADGKVSCTSHSNLSYNSLSNVDETVKNTVQTLIDNSNATIHDAANQVLANLSGGKLGSSAAVPRLVCQAIAEYALSQGYDIHLAMVNNASSDLSSGDITYTELYEAIPFDNIVYIAKVSGKDLLKEASYSGQSIWRVNGRAIEDSDTAYYLIAVIDYLLYHQNSYRSYNYFPSAFTSGFDPIPLTKEGETAYNYRLITRDFLLSQQTIYAENYTKTNIRTNADMLTQSVDLPTTNIIPHGLSALEWALIALAVAVVVVAVVVTVVIVNKKRNAKA